MALGTTTVNNQGGRSAISPVYHDDITFVGDNAYPTGGTANFTSFIRNLPAFKNLRTILDVNDNGGIATHYPVYDKVNDKLKVFVRTTGVEVANATDLSGITFRILVTSY